MLAEAQVIDVSSIDVAPRIVFGATVTLVNLSNDAEVTYQIVGEEEADIQQGLISVASPIARALIMVKQKLDSFLAIHNIPPEQRTKSKEQRDTYLEPAL